MTETGEEVGPEVKRRPTLIEAANKSMVDWMKQGVIQPGERSRHAPLGPLIRTDAPDPLRVAAEQMQNGKTESGGTYKYHLADESEI